MKIDGLNVVKPHQILPRIGRHKIQIDIEQKTINPYNSIADITKELKEAFKGY
jgi:hypothetical protein